MDTYPPVWLREVVRAIFSSAGAGPRHAGIVADHLVDADLAGHASHGVLRVSQYISAIENGEVEPAAEPKIVDRHGGVTVLDGCSAFGQVAAGDAMDIAIGLAREGGIAAVTVRNCGHSGRLGAYAQQAASAGMISLIMVNAGGGGQSVTPFGGRARRLATNPLAMGAPTDGAFPLVLDFATSMAPEGKIRDYARRGERLPEGWLVDAAGAPSTRPDDLYADPGGAILPLGGPVGYKGFALAFFVDIFAGALSGAGCCNAHDVPARDGILMIALNPDLFSGSEYIRQEIGQLVEHVKSCPTAPGYAEVYAPGELEFRQREYHRQHGIPIDETTVAELQAIAERAGVAWLPQSTANGEPAVRTELPRPGSTSAAL